MTATEFISECERVTGNGKVRLMPEQRAVYIQKLHRFNEKQLSAIYDKVLELTEHFPKVKNIYDAAQALGYLEDTEQREYKPHVWEPTDCSLCRGEGQLAVFWDRFFEKTEQGVYEIMKLDEILPYSNSTTNRGGIRTYFRCKCLAGDAKTLPLGLPKWGTDIEPVRRRLMSR